MATVPAADAMILTWAGWLVVTVTPATTDSEQRRAPLVNVWAGTVPVAIVSLEVPPAVVGSVGSVTLVVVVVTVVGGGGGATVVNVASAPWVVPSLLVATIRKWYGLPGTRSAMGSETVCWGRGALFGWAC